MSCELTIKRPFHTTLQHRGRRNIRDGVENDLPAGRITRVSRLMALAIRCDQLIRDGVIVNQSEMAHYGQITTARMTQIMWLLNLAPEIQEEILFLPRVQSGRAPIKELEVRPIAKELDWARQRSMWTEVRCNRLGED